MINIEIRRSEETKEDKDTLVLSYQNANKMLPILRSDHFKVNDIPIKNLKFLIQLSRLLKSDGSVVLTGELNQQLGTLLARLNLHQSEDSPQGTVFFKSKPEVKVQEKQHKLAIGFKSNENEEQIDQGDLLKDENLEIKKKKVEKCETKVRACANCNCGRKDAKENVSKEELLKGINEGRPVSGCGKCYLGDSFRCATCPYNGLPAFKPGDKLKLVEQGGVIVEEGPTVVSTNGKVKLEL